MSHTVSVVPFVDSNLLSRKELFDKNPSAHQAYVQGREKELETRSAFQVLPVSTTPAPGNLPCNLSSRTPRFTPVHILGLDDYERLEQHAEKQQIYVCIGASPDGVSADEMTVTCQRSCEVIAEMLSDPTRDPREDDKKRATIACHRKIGENATALLLEMEKDGYVERVTN